MEYLLGILYEDIVRKRDSWNSSCDRWIFFATAAARHLMSREMLEPESPPEDAELDENFELEVGAFAYHESKRSSAYRRASDCWLYSSAVM